MTAAWNRFGIAIVDSDMPGRSIRSMLVIGVTAMAAATLVVSGFASDPETRGATATSNPIDVPPLPFDDNPDPDQCGIPVQWGDGPSGWLTGSWEGELIEPEVHLYDSHLRSEVVGTAAHGTPVEIVLFQENPVLDYYYVRVGTSGLQGWVPAPFVSFDLVD